MFGRIQVVIPDIAAAKVILIRSFENCSQKNGEGCGGIHASSPSLQNPFRLTARPSMVGRVVWCFLF